MNIKPIIFFIIIFGIILWGYFSYDTFSKYVPIHIIIKVVLFGVALIAMFIPQMVDKFKEGKDMNDIKKFMV
jgi:RsiW-degrading membrane proteinase PrsW (M82 family)